jgi:nucleoside-diphosphate-sugar epimerase
LTGVGGGETVREISQDTPFSMVALTGSDLSGTSARVRARQADGSWGRWYATENLESNSDDSQPGGPRGTDPIFVGTTTAVQISVSRPTSAPQTVAPPESGLEAGRQLGYVPATKIGADQIALSFFIAFDTPVSVIRPFNTYGPRQSARAIIPTVITQIASGKRRIKLGALQPTRDFNFVDDTVAGFMAALHCEKAHGEVINLGSNFEISVGDTARAIAAQMGADVEWVCDEQRLRPEKSEVERLWADNTKARELLGWTPEFGGVEGFQRGLEQTIAWFCEPGNLSAYKADLYNV